MWATVCTCTGPVLPSPGPGLAHAWPRPGQAGWAALQQHRVGGVADMYCTIAGPTSH
jgi:hypothetical protein